MEPEIQRKSRVDALLPGVDPASTISSAALFGNRREVVILHKGREYRLRLTQNDKLILTA